MFILRSVFDIEVPNLLRGVLAMREEHQLHDVFLKLRFTDYREGCACWDADVHFTKCFRHQGSQFADRCACAERRMPVLRCVLEATRCSQRLPGAPKSPQELPGGELPCRLHFFLLQMTSFRRLTKCDLYLWVQKLRLYVLGRGCSFYEVFSTSRFPICREVCAH